MCDLCQEGLPLEDEAPLGTCGGCGAYGPLGRTHIRNGEECGTYV